LIVKHLILGFSAAGATAAELLRRNDPTAEITVLAAEGHPFYLRLDLEGIFQGKPREQLIPRPPAFWEEKRITVLPERALHVDPAARAVTTPAAVHSFDRLLIAVGSAPVDLPVPGRELVGVVHYHTLTDAERIRDARDRIRHIVIIGGGILGLELAQAAVAFGWDITLLVRGGHVGSPMVDATGGELVLQSLRDHGVHVLLHEEVATFEGEDGRLRKVITKTGRALPADLAAVCIGVRPAVGFLEASGLLTNGQLVINEFLQTPALDIFAAGDAPVVQFPDGERFQNFMWNTATSQARAAALNMAGPLAPWRVDVLYNLDLLFDREFALIGPWHKRHDPGRELHEFTAENIYRGLVTRDGILESAFLLGSREYDRRVRKLVAARIRLGDNLTRVFSPDARPEEFESLPPR
jgi:NAD(P)H-nitrite reductase large subunit